MDPPDKIHKTEDKLFKQISEKGINQLLKRLQIPFKITRLFPEELNLGKLEKRADLIGLNEEDALVNIEFQSTNITKKDIERFGRYATLIRDKKEKCVETVIISTPNNRRKTYNYKINKRTNYEMKVYTLKDINGDLIHKKIKEKVKNNKKLNKQDIIDLILCPLMETKRKISDIIADNVHLINKLKVSKEDRDFIKSMLMLEIEKFIENQAEKNKLKKELIMKFTILKEIYEDGRKDEREKNMIEFAKRLINKGFAKEEILELSQIDEEKLQTLLT